jgi:hypothetical protein
MYGTRVILEDIEKNVCCLLIWQQRTWRFFIKRKEEVNTVKKPTKSLYSLRSSLIRICFIVLLGVVAVSATSMSTYAHSTSHVVPQDIFPNYSCSTTVYSFYQIPSNSAPLHVYFLQATTDAQTAQDMVTVQQTGTYDFVWTLRSSGQSVQDTVTNPVMGATHFGVDILQTQQVQAAPSGDDIIPISQSIWAAGICNTWYADGQKVGGY